MQPDSLKSSSRYGRLSCVGGAREASTTSKPAAPRVTTWPAAARWASHGWKCSMPKAIDCGSSGQSASPATPRMNWRIAWRMSRNHLSIASYAASEKASRQLRACPGTAAGGGGCGSGGIGGVVTGRAQAGKASSASSGSVGAHACAITSAPMSPRRGGSSTLSQPTSSLASHASFASPLASSVATFASSAARSPLTALVARLHTSSTVMAVHAAVGADLGAAAGTYVASMAPVLASGWRSSGAGLAKLSTRAATRRAMRSRGVSMSAVPRTHSTAPPALAAAAAARLTPRAAGTAARVETSPCTAASAQPTKPPQPTAGALAGSEKPSATSSARATASPSARASRGGTALPISTKARDHTSSKRHSAGNVCSVAASRTVK